jgi:DNA-binding NarL/FixJ family response regulator
MKAKVLLADDHTILAEGLRALLEPEFEIVGTVDNGRAAVKAMKNLNPDIVILDISMPLLNGIEAAREIRKLAPRVRIVFLTMHTDRTYVQEAFEAGALAYVIKHCASRDLQLALRKALVGRTYVTPEIETEGALPISRSSGTRKAATVLTARQREVLQLIVEGRTAKEAASILNISSRTVEFHKYGMMQRFGLRTTVQLVQFAIKHKMIPR